MCTIKIEESSNNRFDRLNNFFTEVGVFKLTPEEKEIHLKKWNDGVNHVSAKYNISKEEMKHKIESFRQQLLDMEHFEAASFVTEYIGIYM